MRHLLRAMLLLAVLVSWGALGAVDAAAGKGASGDVSCNGTTTDGDALILLGTHAGRAKPRFAPDGTNCYEANGDVSGDGVIDSRDAQLIWYYLP